MRSPSSTPRPTAPSPPQVRRTHSRCSAATHCCRPCCRCRTASTAPSTPSMCSPPTRGSTRTLARSRSPAGSCTCSGSATWGSSASNPGPPISARSMPRRSSSSSCASAWRGAPAPPVSVHSCPRLEPRSTGVASTSTSRGSSSRCPTRTASATRTGGTPMARRFEPTARCRSGPPPPPRSRAMSTPPWWGWPNSRTPSVTPPSPSISAARPTTSPTGSGRRSSSVDGSGWRTRSTMMGHRYEFGPPTSDICSTPT